MVTDRQHRLEIVQFGHMLHESGFVAATDGNLSVRLDERRLLVTPTCISKGRMRASDLVIVDMEGRPLAGNRRVSSEIGMHLLIYRLRPDVQGIVHAHPPTATGFAASGYGLNRPLVCEVVVGLGSIPLARYGTPGTPELTDALEPLIPHHDAILMANHGVVTFGASLENAYMKMETVEHFAKIALVTHLLGHEQPLGEKEVEKLAAVRDRYNGGAQAAQPTMSVEGDAWLANRGRERPAAGASRYGARGERESRRQHGPACSTGLCRKPTAPRLRPSFRRRILFAADHDHRNSWFFRHPRRFGTSIPVPPGVLISAESTAERNTGQPSTPAARHRRRLARTRRTER